MTDSSNTTNSLAHTKWNCKYHIVFAPKYRRKVFIRCDKGFYKEHLYGIAYFIKMVDEEEGKNYLKELDLIDWPI